MKNTSREEKQESITYSQKKIMDSPNQSQMFDFKTRL